MTIDPNDLSYMERDKLGGISQIKCRGCGRIIESMVEYDHPDLTTQRKLQDGTILRQVHVILRPNNLYKQFLIVLSNGDRHETYSCKDCYLRFASDLDELQYLMESDFNEQVKNEGLDLTAAALFKSRRALGVQR